MSRITDALRDARRKAGLTQRDLAETLGLSPQFMNDVELGRRELPERHYHALPGPIRHAVVAAAIAELVDRIERLRAVLN